jgi:hypothetical protein
MHLAIHERACPKTDRAGGFSDTPWSALELNPALPSYHAVAIGLLLLGDNPKRRISMVRNLSRETLTAVSAWTQLPLPMEVDAEERKSRRRRSVVVDVLSIGGNPTLAVYLSGLFQKFGWTVRRSANLEQAGVFLGDNRAAVAICEETLPGAVWQDALNALNAIPDAPMFVVIGDDKTLLDEVSALGGFDVLTRPLDEAEVIWTVASAWHHWMKRFETLTA